MIPLIVPCTVAEFTTLIAVRMAGSEHLFLVAMTVWTPIAWSLANANTQVKPQVAGVW